MKLTLDSQEPLQDALRVVGALYGVSLVVATEATDPDQPTEPTEPTPPGDTGEPVDAGKPDEPVKPRRARRRASASRGQGSRSRGNAPEADATGEEATSARPLGAPSNAEVRSWARESGLTVSDRGRLPASVLSAYRSAQGG